VSDLRIDVREEGGVARVVFERPGVLNAFAPEDLPRLAEALRAAGEERSARVVVVRGAGGAFSAGDDLKATADLDPEGWRAVVEGFHELTRTVRRLEPPVVCAVDGVCVGGAFEFACSCDLRVATTRSRFGCPEVGLGLTVSNAASVLLSQLCGAGYAAELMLSGRLIDAREALAHGLVAAVVDPKELDARATGVAEEIARRAPLAVRATKRLLVSAQEDAVEQAMRRETETLVSLAGTDDLRAGLRAFREKRPPSFSGS
jgi:enoyl-CoA hydratase/carnithine racemase